MTTLDEGDATLCNECRSHNAVMAGPAEYQSLNSPVRKLLKQLQVFCLPWSLLRAGDERNKSSWFFLSHARSRALFYENGTL